MIIEKNVLNVGRRKNPQGYYVAVLEVETFKNKLQDVIEKLKLGFEISGNIVFIYSKSWSNIEKLINTAKSRGIEVKF